MSQASLKVLALGAAHDPGMLGCYARALERLGHAVQRWHLPGVVEKYLPEFPGGRQLARRFASENAVYKANRELIVEVRRTEPDLILVPGNVPVRGGALAQIKVSVPQAKVVLLWPDPLLNLGSRVIECLPVYDLVASYSSSSLSILEHMGARTVAFLPFGADAVAFPVGIGPTAAERERLDCDVSFICAYRPEREADVVALAEAGLRVKVWGPDWKRRARNRELAKAYFQGGFIEGAEFVKVTKCSRICLNRIDDTNFPAANMRFFELMGCAAAALNSPCPEMEPDFPDNELTFYYRDTKHLVQRARTLIADAALRHRVAQAGHRVTMSGHTYDVRARELLEAINVG